MVADYDTFWKHYLDGVRVDFPAIIPDGTYYYVSYIINNGIMGASHNNFSVQQVTVNNSDWSPQYGHYFTLQADAEEFLRVQKNRHEEMIVFQIKTRVAGAIKALSKRKLDQSGVLSGEFTNMLRALESLEQYCQNK